MLYVFLADGFEETEALATVDVLRRAELDTATVGVGAKQVTGSHGITVLADLEEKDVHTDNMHAVVLPGGMPGTVNLENSSVVKESVTYCIQNGLHVCAICAAPSILGHMGFLQGKRATCFPGFEKELTGAQLSREPAVCDGKIITGKGAGAAIEFALLIVEKIAGRQKALEIRAALQCP